MDPFRSLVPVALRPYLSTRLPLSNIMNILKDYSTLLCFTIG